MSSASLVNIRVKLLIYMSLCVSRGRHIKTPTVAIYLAPNLVRTVSTFLAVVSSASAADESFKTLFTASS